MLVCMCVLVSVFVCVTGYLRYQEMLLRRTSFVHYTLTIAF